jgi:hypothetical protein
MIGRQRYVPLTYVVAVYSQDINYSILVTEFVKGILKGHQADSTIKSATLQFPRMIVNIICFWVACSSVMFAITGGMKYMNLAMGATQEFHQVILPCIGTIGAYGVGAYGVDEAIASFHQTMRVTGPPCCVAWPANSTNIWTSKFRLRCAMR